VINGVSIPFGPATPARLSNSLAGIVLERIEHRDGCYTANMRVRDAVLLSAMILAASAIAEGQARRTTARKPPTPPPPALTRVEADIQCPSELGIGVRTSRRFCDVLTGREPQGGVIVSIPPHRGPATLSFELHNRHTYSEELIKAKTAFRDYLATIGVFTMDNTLIERAAIQSQFRKPSDLVDRINGGAGPGGMKAVAPTGTELITVQLPEDADQVSIVGEKLKVVRADGGVDRFEAPGRPIATISNVMLEYRPAPASRKITRKR